MSAGGLRPGEHKTWVDESGPTIEDPEDQAFQAVCEDCSWCGRWYHLDEFFPAQGPQAAYLSARREGLDHQDDTAETYAEEAK